jgi:hypothetical protein
MDTPLFLPEQSPLFTENPAFGADPLSCAFLEFLKYATWQ